MFSFPFYFVIFLGFFSYLFGKNRAKKKISFNKNSGGQPSHYGYYCLIWVTVPSMIFFLMWQIVSNYIIQLGTIESIPIELLPKEDSLRRLLLDNIIIIAEGGISIAQVPKISVDYYKELKFFSKLGGYSCTIILSIILCYLSFRKIDPSLMAKNTIERFILSVLFISSVVAILTTIGIIMSLIFETTKFFNNVSFFDYIFGLHWSPQTALREGQVAAEGAFGALPVFAGTFLITLIAMLLAGPIGLFSAIYLSEYASPLTRKIIKPTIEVLAGVPTVVYGFFAALVVGPFIRRICESLGFSASSESALAAGLVMGIMIIPFISSLSDDVISAVPQSLREASYGVGATKSETIKKVIIPAALPGIVASFMLAISRAIGETMIVVMAAGLAAKLTANPLESVTTVTVQIVTLLVGDHEFDSTKTRAAFALGITLFSMTLLLNIIALRVVKKYREKYE